MNLPHILVVEADERFRRVLQTTFTAEGYSVQEAATVAAGVLLATRHFADLIVLDIRLPDGSGIDIIRKVREANCPSAIIVLSADANEHDKVTALDAGADDFLNKPVAMGELLARVRVALRRLAQAAGRSPLAIFRTGEIEVNLQQRRIRLGKAEVRLTPLEYKLLEVLVRHADQVVTHQRLLREVWGADSEPQILRLYMSQLRRKLEENPARPRYLLTQAGVGYRLVTQHFPEAWKDVATPERTTVERASIRL